MNKEKFHTLPPLQYLSENLTVNEPGCHLGEWGKRLPRLMKKPGRWGGAECRYSAKWRQTCEWKPNLLTSMAEPWLLQNYKSELLAVFFFLFWGVNQSPGAKCSPAHIFASEVLLPHCVHHLHILYGCFLATLAEHSSCDQVHVTTELKLYTIWFLTEKSLLACVLHRCLWLVLPRLALGKRKLLNGLGTHLMLCFSARLDACRGIGARLPPGV